MLEYERAKLNQMIAAGMSLTDPRVVKQSQLVDKLLNEKSPHKPLQWLGN
jgi:hypothetical protein